MALLENLSESLQNGKVKEVEDGINQALAEGIAPQKILHEGLMAGMDVIGEKFKNKEIFVPEVLIAARAMNAGMEILKPKLVESGVEAEGRVVLGTVRGDLHDIGKNLVGMMLEGAGFDVFDLGTDVTEEEFVKEVEDKDPHIVGLSALLTTTMPEIGNVIKALKDAGLRDKVTVMIGGAPVNEGYVKEVNADYYAKDAAQAASIAKEVQA
ncbi:MAG: corrinoid protein [Halanaerobiales bacterium]